MILSEKTKLIKARFFQRANIQKVKFEAIFQKVLNSKLVVFIFNTDITFLFLFLALYLFGYNWDWKVLVASLGVWMVFKEVIKHIKKSSNMAITNEVKR